MVKRREVLVLLIIAVSIGILTGISAALFNQVVIIGVKFTKNILDTSKHWFILMPLVAAAITGVLYQLVLRKQSPGIGVTQVLLELKTPETYFLKPISVFWHVVATIVSLVLGMTAGRFGPITHLGAAIGSNLAAYFKLDEGQMKLMIGCGAAGAISTVFNLPFFAALFVLEVLFRERNFRLLSPLIISSLVANQVGVALLGYHSQIASPMGTLFELKPFLWSYIGLGIGVGFISALYIEAIEHIGNAMQAIKGRFSGLLVGALLVGFSAYIFPEQFELHFDTTNLLLNNHFEMNLLLSLVFLRILLTAVTLGAGFIGGNFYPGLTIGAAMGVVSWRIMGQVGLEVANQLEMGVLGIAGMTAGFLHAPLACIVLAVELTGSASFVMPAMLVTATAVTVSYLCSGYDLFARPLGRLLTSLHYKHSAES